MKDLIEGAAVGVTVVTYLIILFLVVKMKRLDRKVEMLNAELGYKSHEFDSLRRRLETRVGLIAEL